MKTCLNRLIGRCEKICEMDYDTTHHPNNYDCKDYKEVNFFEFEVKERDKKSRDYFRKFVSETLRQDSPVGELLKKIM